MVHKLLNFFILTLFLLVQTFVCVGQEYLFNIQKINVEDGLPKRSIYDIQQDAKGFVWLSLQGMLVRYDGETFEVYDENFLGIRSGGQVLFAIDKEDRIWYTEGHVQGRTLSGIYDQELDSIFSIADFSNNLLSAKDIRFFNPCANNEILIGTNQGELYKYDGQFTLLYDFQTEPLHFQSFFESDTLCVGINNTFCHIVNHKIIWQSEITDQVLMHKYVNKPIFKTHNPFDDGRRYWFIEPNKVEPFYLPSFTNEQIYNVYYVDDDLSYFSTVEDIIIQKADGTILWKYDNFFQRNTAKRIKYNCSFFDQQGILWVGTNDGLIKISKQKNPFEISHKKNSIRLITHLFGKEYIGGYYGNFHTDLNTKVSTEFLREYVAASGYSIQDDTTVWIGSTVANFFKHNPQKMTFEDIRYSVGAIYQPYYNQETQHLLLGTEDGLYYFRNKEDLTTKIPLLEEEVGIEVRQLYKNNDGIWIVSSRGLFLINSKTEQVTQSYTKANGFPTNNFNHLYEDKDGVFWIGTRDKGLIRWDKSKNDIQVFDEENGLSNNNIYAVYPDDFGGLWLPSNYGLMRFDKSSYDAVVYLSDDGIAHNEFNTFAHYKDKDGFLYFGGINGITKFHPKDLYNDEHNFLISINRVKVLNDDSEFYTDITNDFTANKKISIGYKNRILRLQLALLDYTNPDENRFAYKILNHHNQWIYLDGNEISINNLSPGTHRLSIKARGANSNWQVNEMIVEIYVKPPFYRTWWFISVSVVFISLCIWWYFRSRTIRLRQANIALEKTVKERTQQIEKDKATIEQQAKALKTLDQAKSRFFANITHEFRTPLTLIIGPLQQLNKEIKNAKQSATLRTAINNANQLLGLINQLLDISKMESSEMQLEYVYGNIETYTNSIIQLFQPLALQQNKRLAFIPSVSNADIYFDKEKWSKIVSNLVANAIKYTEENGQVTVHLSVIENNIKLSVKDTGIGISEDDLSRIFDRFYQTNESRETQLGTGIGLTLVKELVELQKGKVEVESAVGQGSLFKISLPIPNEANVNTTTHTVKTAAVSTMNQTSVSSLKTPKDEEPKQLLIIEDNPEMRAYIRSCIDENQYHILEANNGEVGIEVAFEKVPDVIISDVMMPKKDGYQVVQAIRNNLSTSHIPLILLTAKASLESRLEGLKRGADAYLTKPFNPDELILRVEKLLEIRRLIQQQIKGKGKSNENDTSEKKFTQEHQFIKDIQTYVLENMDNDQLSVESLSQHFYMSRMQFYRKVKALTDETPAEIIRKQRLEKAYQILKTKAYNSLSDVAFQVGFASLSSFSKAFKKYYGKSPSEV